MYNNECNRNMTLGEYHEKQEEKRGDIKIKDDTKVEMEGMDVETLEEERGKMNWKHCRSSK